MKKARCYAITVTVLAFVTTSASADIFGFTRITGNSNYDVGNQLSVDVQWLGSSLVSFRFDNVGPLASSITAIYFDDANDNLLNSLSSIDNSSAGVNFTAGGSPPNLPGGNNAGPSFSSDFRVSSTSPRSPNGVGIGEFVTLAYSMQNGVTFNDVLAGLNGGELRIGMHVQSMPDGDSDSYINVGTAVPSPDAGMLGILGISALSALRRRV